MNDGGPAFPVPEHGGAITDETGCTHREFHAHSGMSLRDWFAGQAMLGIISDPTTTDHFIIVGAAYAVADTMLAARGGQAVNLAQQLAASVAAEAECSVMHDRFGVLLTGTRANVLMAHAALELAHAALELASRHEARPVPTGMGSNPHTPPKGPCE